MLVLIVCYSKCVELFVYFCCVLELSSGFRVLVGLLRWYSSCVVDFGVLFALCWACLLVVGLLLVLMCLLC